MLRRALLIALALCASSVAQDLAAQQINNTTGGSDVWYTGLAGKRSDGVLQGFGQIFTAPSGANVLSDFSFWLGDFRGPGTLGVNAYLGAWNGSTVTSLLWSGALASFPTNAVSGTSLSTFQKTTFQAGQTLVGGNSYAAFLAPIAGTGPAGEDLLMMAWRSRLNATGATDQNGQSMYTYAIPGSLPSQYSRYSVSADYAFEANFTTVPEPGTLLLLLVGLSAFGLVTWRQLGAGGPARWDRSETT